LRLAEHGWTVFAGVRRAEDGDRLKAEVTGGVRPVILDVSDRDHTRRVIEDFERRGSDPIARRNTRSRRWRKLSVRSSRARQRRYRCHSSSRAR
jgi:NAD(P)-dependent dehydrogenase (short-subunit alcohol dehydrogenase family)